MEELTNLHQSLAQSVRDYRSRFEMLTNHTTGSTEEFLISYFISGLKEDLKHDIQIFHPTSIFVVIRLARIQEEK